MTVPSLCYPTNYRREDPDDNLDYGLIRNTNEAPDYHYTFNLLFYTREAAHGYKQDNHKEDSQDKQDDMDEDGNEEDNDIAEGILGTPIHRNAKQRGKNSLSKTNSTSHKYQHRHHSAILPRNFKNWHHQ